MVGLQVKEKVLVNLIKEGLRQDGNMLNTIPSKKEVELI